MKRMRRCCNRPSESRSNTSKTWRMPARWHSKVVGVMAHPDQAVVFPLEASPRRAVQLVKRTRITREHQSATRVRQGAVHPSVSQARPGGRRGCRREAAGRAADATTAVLRMPRRGLSVDDLGPAARPGARPGTARARRNPPEGIRQQWPRRFSIVRRGGIPRSAGIQRAVLAPDRAGPGGLHLDRSSARSADRDAQRAVVQCGLAVEDHVLLRNPPSAAEGHRSPTVADCSLACRRRRPPRSKRRGSGTSATTTAGSA